MLLLYTEFVQYVVLLLVCRQLLSADMASAQPESDGEARMRAAVIESQQLNQTRYATLAQSVLDLALALVVALTRLLLFDRALTLQPRLWIWLWLCR